MEAQQKQIVVISGPTGSGENTITKKLVERFSNVKRLITSTTRPQRSEEQGDEYYFFSKEEFLDKAARGEILEVNYQKNRDVYYGTYAPPLLKMLEEGRTIIVNSDIVGTRYFKEHYDAATIFIETPTVDDLMIRVKTRNPEMSDEELARRRENAENEIKNEKPFYDYVITNENGKLDSAIDAVVAILKEEGYSLEV